MTSNVKYLVAALMDNTIKVYDMEKQTVVGGFEAKINGYKAFYVL